MWQITEHAREGRRTLSPADFDRDFLALCEAHRAQGRALAFAFIVFDARAPHLRKAIEDDAYWEAFDALSGRELTVFTFMAYFHDRAAREPPHAMRAMFGVPANLAAIPQNRLAELFPGLGRSKLPAVLFFQVDKGEVLGSIAASLSVEGDPATAYNEVAGVLKTALESIEAVDDENAGNARAIFGLIESALKDRARARKAVAIYNGVRKLPLTGILKIVHGLL
jgi:hypothetical protein